MSNTELDCFVQLKNVNYVFSEFLQQEHIDT